MNKLPDEGLYALTTLVKVVLSTLTDKERIEFVDHIMEEYCKRCGFDEAEGKCYCDAIYDE